MAFIGRVFIYGGKGALGAKCVSHFKANNFWVGVIDLGENAEADHNILVNRDQPLVQQEETILSAVGEALDGRKLDGIFCVAGGWVGGKANKDLVRNAELMWQQSVHSSLIAVSIATAFLKEGAVLQLTGAHAALTATPGMIAYGMAKAAVHQMTLSLGGPNSGMPARSLVATILPVTLDTPMNRQWMPDGDTASWTPLEFVADLFLKWTVGNERPASGSLLQLITKNKITKVVPVTAQ